MAATQVTADVIKDGSITAVKLAAGALDGAGGAISWQSSVKTSSFTGVAGEGYFVDTTSGAVTVSLPAGSVGDEIHFTDYGTTFDTNQITFDANGSQKILGTTDNHKCITESATVRLIYQNDTKGWTADNIITVVDLGIDFLVIAGGGGTGYQTFSSTYYYHGGGGGGGFRSSTDGRGGGEDSDTKLQIVLATNYTVTVGAGGAAGGYNSVGGTGADSVFSTITSKGGGGGATYAANTGNGVTGGSGGGGAGAAGNNATGGAPLLAPGNILHGYRGGNAASGSSSGSAGGGGAGGQGVDQTGNAEGTDGGPAKVATITGSNVYYSAGGGGDKGYGGGSAGSAGTNAAGGVNSGDGRTGGGGAGESGVVILKYPTALTITVGSGLTSSTAALGTTHKVTIFTDGTGNIHFDN